MSKPELKTRVFAAAAAQGINSILFRNAMARKLGLNVTESACLSLLGIKGISTPTELARFTGLTTGSTTTMLDRLEQKGIIKRKPNPDDRRGVLIEITEDYGKTSKALVVGIQKAHKILIDKYTDAELETIADFLEGFTQNIITSTREIENGIA
jgi:DNA-binding MarR family transcriptional regulator